MVLAAGQGTRMRSSVPKVLHPLAGRPLILHVVERAAEVTGRRPLVVVSPAHPEVVDAVAAAADTVEQREPKGTGDALRSVPERLREPGPVLVLSGDVPLLRAETLRAMLRLHDERRPACTLLSVSGADLAGLGRLMRDGHGRVVAVVEERDLPEGDASGAEGNAGVYVFDGTRLWPALEGLDADNAQGEHYLTSLIARFAPEVEVMAAGDPLEALGINDRRQLAAAEAVLRRRLLDQLMLEGVTVEDPATTYVDAEVRVGRDSVLHPMTSLRGVTVLGEACEIGPMAQLREVRTGDRVRIGASHLEESVLEDEVTIGPWNRVRPGCWLGRGVELGTHAEVKNSRIGARSRIGHFSCVLDSEVGEGVNIGAGTVTCNYDGLDKHPTVIGDGVFVGTDSILVAPLRIGDGAYIAAGSVITHDVPAGALAVERAPQNIIAGWAARRRKRAAGASARGESRA